MGTTSPDAAARVLDLLERLDTASLDSASLDSASRDSRSTPSFAVLHGEADISQGTAVSDIDLAVARDPHAVVADLSNVLALDGLVPIMLWPYDRNSLTVFWSDIEGERGVQLDLVHDPSGHGRYGFRTDSLISGAERGERWPRLNETDGLLYLIRKRQVKRDQAEVRRLLASVPEGRAPEFEARARQSYAEPACSQLVEMLRTRAFVEPSSNAAFDRRWRNIAANPGFYWSRVRQARTHDTVGAWVSVSGATVEEIESALEPLAGLLPSMVVRNGIRSGAQAWPHRMRARLLVTADGDQTDPRADIQVAHLQVTDARSSTRSPGSGPSSPGSSGSGRPDPGSSGSVSSGSGSSGSGSSGSGSSGSGSSGRDNSSTGSSGSSSGAELRRAVVSGLAERVAPSARQQGSPRGGGLAVFYADAFQEGGAPVGIQHLARALSATQKVTIYGRRSDNELDLGSANRREYDSIAELPFALDRWLKEDRPDLLVVIGFFIPHNPIAFAVAAKAGVPTALHPMSQVADAILVDRVFTHGCEVSDLEQQALNAERAKDRIAAQISPIAKRVFLATAGRFMVAKSDALAVLSEEEGRQIRAMYPGTAPDESIAMPWGTDVESIPDESDEHFYRDDLGLNDGRANLVVWCRLDYRFKGLDRAIEGMRWIKDQADGQAPNGQAPDVQTSDGRTPDVQTSDGQAPDGQPPDGQTLDGQTPDGQTLDGRIPVRLFLCGPDYRGGVLAAERHIAEAGLENDVFILGPDQYRPGSKKPLRDADATVLLSRWDGSPRTLREAAHYGTPMIVCEETNFADLVRASHGVPAAGIVVDGDEAADVGRAYLAMADPGTQAQAAEGARALAARSTWACIGTDLLRQARARL